METEATAFAPVMRIYGDAREDSLVAAYSLLVVAPLSALVARHLLRRGSQTTPTHALLGALLVPALFVGVPAAYHWVYGPVSVYKLLGLSRVEPLYLWARKYSYWRDMFQKGQMPQDVWATIDSAYDMIYDEKARFLYDFWGPETNEMTLLETQCNVGLFYVLWGTILFALTSPKATARASKWTFSALLALFGFEISVRLLHYDPIKAKGVLTFLTPREVVQWLHRLFPAFVFTVVTLKRVFFVDMDLHQQQLLRNMANKNQRTTERLAAIAEELKAEQTKADAEAAQ